MKKSSSLFIVLLISCITIFFSLNSCSKKDEVTKDGPKSLNADKSQYSSYEIVTISDSSSLFSIESFPAKINNIEITVSAIENKASFVLPNLINGNYNLSFTINDKDYIVPITVSSLSNVLSADFYFNEIKTNINQNISDLNSQINILEQTSTNPNEYEKLKNDVLKYTNLLNNYTSSYNSLSTGEKQEFAKSIAANQASVKEYDNLTSALHTSTTILRTQTIQNYEADVEVSKGAFVSSVIFTVAHIPAMVTTAKLMASPNPWISVGAVVATGLIFTSYCINLDETITASHKLTNKSIKPFEFITQTSQTVYNTGVETLSDIQAKYRSLINSDINNSSNGNTISAIVGKYNYFKDKYNGFINALPAIFRPSYVMTSLKNTYSNTTRSIYNQYISITNVSNPNITVQKIDQPDGSIKIKATTTATSDQTFTYDVNYTNSNFTSGLKQTVNAKILIAIDSIEIYKASAIGAYTVYGPPAVGNGPNSRLYCELKTGGVAVYTIYDDPSWPNGYSWNIGWVVRKVNNQYYILTGWTNPGYLQAEAQPLTYPVTNFVYRHRYVK